MKAIKIILAVLFLIIILIVGFWIKNTQNQLKETIKQQDNHLSDIFLEKKLNDSICGKMWEHFPFGSPVDIPIIGSKFGLRKDPFTRRWKRHQGIDFEGTYRDTVYSTGAGFVETASYFGGYGRCVIINHGKGYKTMYAHLSKIYVVKNEYVDDHHKIGRIGNTGHSTGAHLHYEIIENDISINPERFIWIKF